MTDVEPKTPTRRRTHKPRGLGHAKATAGVPRVRRPEHSYRRSHP